MSIPDFTIVLGLDAKHFEQLKVTIPTWKRHKPSLLQDRKVIAFYDDYGMCGAEQSKTDGEIHRLIGDDSDVLVVPWPDADIDYGDGVTKWDSPQRHKMLAGFLHIAADYCETEYVLKLDTDSIATGMDNWIDSEWFDDSPSIIAPPWRYTKPGHQMLELDAWADRFHVFPNTRPLHLAPEPGSEILRHQRIAGWCDFFRSTLIRSCATAARDTVGRGLMPVPSLDGYLFYAATRTNRGIRRVNMKARGWNVLNSMSSIREAAERAMA